MKQSHTVTNTHTNDICTEKKNFFIEISIESATKKNETKEHKIYTSQVFFKNVTVTFKKKNIKIGIV